MSEISISFPPWMIAWFLLGEATPFITIVLISLAAVTAMGNLASGISDAFSNAAANLT